MTYRLSVLMFLVYAPLGAMLPFFSLRLKEDLGFSSFDIGLASATQALGALFASLLAGQVADRYLAPERCLSFCAAAAGVLLWLLAGGTEPGEVFALSIAFWLAMAPVLSLGAAVVFIHLSNPQNQFGRVRVWGTVGWVMQGWMLALWFDQPGWLTAPLRAIGLSSGPRDYGDAFRLGALLLFVLALFVLTLPATPPRRHSPTALAPLQAARLLRRPSFAVYFLCSLALCITVPFTSQTTSLLLRHLGVPQKWLGPAMSVGQSLEIVGLLLLPLLLSRWGMRRLMLTGAVAWTLGLLVLAVGKPAGLVIVSLGTHGLFICCFVIVGQVYINSQAGGDIRASAQALIAVTNALGQLGGHLLTGWVRGLSSDPFALTFGLACAIALAALALFYFGFQVEREEEGRADEPEA